ncbi:MAG TPA: transcription-repair coupling factor [Opitutales bacterium]|nr:transcription-repair coupling factor [Opitutales bacterium]
MPAFLEQLARAPTPTTRRGANASMAVAIILARTARLLDALAEDLQFFQNLAQGEKPSAENSWAKVMLYPELPGADAESTGAAGTFERQCDRLAVLAALASRNGNVGTSLATAHSKHEAIKPPSGKRAVASDAPTEEGSAGAGRSPEGESGQLIIVTTLAAVLQPAPRPDDLAAREIRLARGTRVNFHELAEKLTRELGYDSEALCETPGQFAVRGGLLDVYPFNAAAPVRLDFFGDELESIRAFDPTTQLTAETLAEILIAPAPREMTGAAAAGFLNFLPARAHWLVCEPARQAAEQPEIFSVPEKLAAPNATLQTILQAREKNDDAWTGLAELDESGGPFDAEAKRSTVDSEPTLAHRPLASVPALGRARLESDQASQHAFLRLLAEWARQGTKVFIVAHAEHETGRLKEILAEDSSLKGFTPKILSGGLSAGFIARGAGEVRLDWPVLKNDQAVAIVAEGEIFGRHRQRLATFRSRQLPQRHRVDQLLDFSEIAEGDYLVHVMHGVCRFRGIRKLAAPGRHDEVISLEFAEGVELHVPLHESHLLSRYVGLAKISPKLGKIGGRQWEKTRAEAERATLDFAAQLLRVQAERNHRPGFAFPADAAWQREFEDDFPHEETADQLRAINDTKADLERGRPMDRLLCGDVGFGKTEVALRAAFKAVLGGKQVAVLAPTTILVQQHANTFRERLAPFPVAVEQLSRFRSPKQQKQVIEQLREGQLDIVIGTHRLFGADVKFKDLGLLIIDEEHRFGVRHKEKIKQLRADVHVLAMSATPIPRTLYFALVGARDLSVIETPPRDRLPIETVVKSYSPELVREAIRFELARGGQVFYLHNRVESIDDCARRLRELVPTARIGIGHGQMDAEDLEIIMTRFVAGEFDVLICTTIIESGLDIPNCNTLIIEGADRFGLAQLYQLRGRVGRFNRQAYAYLLLHRHAKLLDQARHRLAAIRQFTQPGAGFRLAMKDLELRGAGNLLGAEQSGHIAGVGFDLYCQLLRQSIARLKGDPAAVTVRASVRLDFITVGEAAGEAAPIVTIAATDDSGHGYSALKEADLAGGHIKRLAASLPVEYIADTRLRLDQYRRLALAGTPKEVGDIAAALKNRFGKLPESTRALVKLAEIRVWAEQKGIVEVETEGDRLKCRRAARRGQATDYVQIGNRFPRLTAVLPLQRMEEIVAFLKRQATPTL